MWFFPVDDETLKYLKITGRDKKKLKLLKNFAESKSYGTKKITVKLCTTKY